MAGGIQKSALRHDCVFDIKKGLITISGLFSIWLPELGSNQRQTVSWHLAITHIVLQVFEYSWFYDFIMLIGQINCRACQ